MTAQNWAHQQFIMHEGGFHEAPSLLEGFLAIKDCWIWCHFSYIPQATCPCCTKSPLTNTHTASLLLNSVSNTDKEEIKLGEDVLI